MRTLTDAEKIEILELSKKELKKYTTKAKIVYFIEHYSNYFIVFHRFDNHGLCCFIKYGIRYYKEMDFLPSNKIKLYFKDFLHENSKIFGGCNSTVWWWALRPYDYKNRLAFLDWMITRIKEGKEGQ
jgi:hypothetical protein